MFGHVLHPHLCTLDVLLEAQRQSGDMGDMKREEDSLQGQPALRPSSKPGGQGNISVGGRVRGAGGHYRIKQL